MNPIYKLLVVVFFLAVLNCLIIVLMLFVYRELRIALSKTEYFLLALLSIAGCISFCSPIIFIIDYVKSPGFPTNKTVIINPEVFLLNKEVCMESIDSGVNKKVINTFNNVFYEYNVVVIQTNSFGASEEQLICNLKLAGLKNNISGVVRIPEDTPKSFMLKKWLKENLDTQNRREMVVIVDDAPDELNNLQLDITNPLVALNKKNIVESIYIEEYMKDLENKEVITEIYGE